MRPSSASTASCSGLAARAGKPIESARPAKATRRLIASIKTPLAFGVEDTNLVPVDGLERGAREEQPSAFPLGRVCQHLRRRKNFRHVPLCLRDGLGEL
jgi:hypothetical protein